MIPKIIHYCWFGKGKMPPLALKCIETWENILPEYELKLWDEETFDINSNLYVKQAYEAKKFAFVSDFVRLYALKNEGGIYMDTDVEVLKKLDDFLVYPAFSGFESEKDIPTGIMGSEKNGLWVEEQLKYYENRTFIKHDGSLDITTNVQIISKNMSQNGFVLENRYQVYKNCMHIFPKDYFCPKSRSGVVHLTENSVCIHHFNGSWNSKGMKFKKFFFHKFLGVKITDKLIKLKRSFLKKSK